MPNKTQLKNLRKLAEYMISLPVDYNSKHFRMRQFLTHNYDSAWIGEVIEQDLLGHCICNTTACAVGHAPTLFPKQTKRILEKYDEEELNYEGKWTPRLDLWNVLARELFGVGNPHEQDANASFSWLFGGEWDTGSSHEYCSTSWAVADRIMWFLDGHWTGCWGYDQYDETMPGNIEWEKAKYYSVEAGLISKEALMEKIAQLKTLENA